MRTFRFSLVLVVLVAALWFVLDRPSSERSTSPSGAMQALDFWAAARAYPAKVMPDVGHAAAFTQAQLQRRVGGLDGAVAPWTGLGPGNFGGRTLALALDPNNPDVIWAGSASGGLWRSTTGGVGAVAWQRIDTAFPTLAVSTIAIQADDSSVMYAGTGEVYAYQGSIGGDVVRTTRGSYGIGILKTTDGGSTWSLSLDWTAEQTRGVWAVRIHPTDASIVFATTTEGIYRSTDAGASWHVIHAVLMGMDLQLHPSDPNILYASHGNFGSSGNGIYRSTDGGDTWAQTTNGLPSSWTGKAQLGVSVAASDYVFASVANTFAGIGLYRSTDAGVTWQLRNTTDYPQYQGWYSHYVAVSPFDADRLFTGGIEIYRSTNGGGALSQRSQWTQVFFGTPPPEGPTGGPQYAHADHHAAVPHPTDPDAFFFASDGGVFKTTDNGNTFVSLNGGYVVTQFYNGFVNAATTADLAIGGMQDNFTAIYEGTSAWRRVIGGDGSWAAINPLDPDTMYGSYQYLGIRRSRNGFVSSSNIIPPDAGEETAFIAPYVLCPSSPLTLYAGRERVYKSTNEGTTWLATNGGSPLSSGDPVISMDVSSTDADVVFAGTAPLTSPAKIFRTTDGGVSWINVTGSLPDRYPMDLSVDPNDDQTVYVALAGFGTSHVYRSTDAGATWIDVGSGLPDVPASAVIVNPDDSNHVYVGLDIGVFASTDAGSSWEPFFEGMPPALVNDLKVYAPDRKLRAATHGNGVYERDLVPLSTDVGTIATGAGPELKLTVSPNPVRTGGSIDFEIPKAGRVRLALFDVAGRRVADLLDESRPAGFHRVSLPEALSAGVYFAVLEADGRRSVERVVATR